MMGVSPLSMASSYCLTAFFFSITVPLSLLPLSSTAKFKSVAPQANGNV